MADATGDPMLNKQLSEKRAEAVAVQLRKAVDAAPGRIAVTSFGERLATGDATVAERKVEFVFYVDQGLPARQVIMASGVLSDDWQRKQRAR
jgi:outer membrane protein OmpA-like peptidoglycan-associated protein